MEGVQLAVYVIATFFALRSLSSLMSYQQKYHSIQLAKQFVEEAREAQRATLEAEKEAAEAEANAVPQSQQPAAHRPAA